MGVHASDWQNLVLTYKQLTLSSREDKAEWVPQIPVTGRPTVVQLPGISVSSVHNILEGRLSVTLVHICSVKVLTTHKTAHTVVGDFLLQSPL